MLVNGVSVALDETAREVSERQVLPAGGLRERFELQRPIAVPRASLLLFGANRSVSAQTAARREPRSRTSRCGFGVRRGLTPGLGARGAQAAALDHPALRLRVAEYPVRQPAI